MKRLRSLVILALPLALAVVPLRAGEKAVYQTGKLVDLRCESTGSGAARAQGSFCLAVEVGDMTYLLRREAYWRWSYEPTDFVVGDPVEIKIKGNDMYLKKSKGGDLKTYITRRERNAPDKKPITCALPVCKRIEEVFGWMKSIGLLRKLRHRGLERVGWMFTFTAAAYNLVRIRNLTRCTLRPQRA